jgi:hypothetical protein
MIHGNHPPAKIAGLQQMDINDGLIRQLRLKIAFLLVLRYELFSLTIFGFLLGLVALVVRVTFAVPRQALLWGLLGLLPCGIWAVIRAIRETPSHKALCALFDERNQCGGLLMAAEEVNLGAWKRQLPPLSSPKLKWHGSRSLTLFTSAAIFVVISFIVPQRYVNMASARPLNISEDVEKLEEQVDTLEEESVISEEEAQELEEKLKQLRDTSSAYDPVKTWEALDHLQQNLQKKADQFAASSLSQTEDLAETQTLAQGLFEDSADLDPDLLSEAMSELATMLQSNALKDELLKNGLNAESLKACEQGNLSSEQLNELLKALKANKGKISSQLAKLYKVRLVDLETLKLCKKLGTCNSKGLIAFLNENADSMGMCNALSLYCQPCRGGINRGRGDAPMTWTDGSNEEDTIFKEQVLPPASLAALKDSMLIGVSIGAPTVEENPESSTTDALNSATVGSGEAFSHTVLPRHKGVVERYFERE